MRNKESIRNTASQLLEGEFENLKHNPVDFCKAMGWHRDSPGTKKAVKKADDLCWTSKDTDQLAAIIESKGDAELLDIVESGEVQDFLTNCVARHIQA